MKIHSFVLACSLLIASACSSAAHKSVASDSGFDASRSDPRAIELADATMDAMGGRAAWDRVRVLQWTFFKGNRKHVWDKWTGDLRVEDGATLVLMNLSTGKGRVYVAGVEITDPDVRAEALDVARKQWINDSYWLLMPYKLKDAGVRLQYGGESQFPDGRVADALVVTFDSVGVTPQNKYHVWISRDTGLVEMWSYFENAKDAEPKITTPWTGWASYAGIFLSGRRGDRQLTDIAAFTELTPELEAKLNRP